MTISDRAEPIDPVGRTDPLDQFEPIPAAPAQRPQRTRGARPAGTAPAGYTQAWSLFADWCAATDHQAQPANPATVLAFLQACPAAAATQRRRVAAINHHHTAAGHSAPGDRDDVRAAVGRPLREPVWVCPDRAVVDAALRALPSHAFTQGLFGQRDRALLVLAYIAGLPYKSIAALTVTDLRHDANTGTVAISTSRRGYAVDPVDDPMLCPACVLARWLDTHTVLTRHIATRRVAAYFSDIGPVTGSSTHRCRAPSAGTGEAVALLPPIDQWGHVPFPQPRLSPHAVSQQARELMAGDIRVRRDRAVIVEPDGAIEQQKPADVDGPPARAYGAAERDAAWNRRREDLRELSAVADNLGDVERRAAELNQRAAELLADYSPT